MAMVYKVLTRDGNWQIVTSADGSLNPRKAAARMAERGAYFRIGEADEFGYIPAHTIVRVEYVRDERLGAKVRPLSL